MNWSAQFQKSLLVTAIAIAALSARAWRAEAAPYVQTDLVSDIPGLATITDPELVNPWGVSFSATSPFWTSNQGTSTATLYAVTDSTNVTKTVINPPAGDVIIPPGGTGAVGPTGQVNNTNTSSFLIPTATGGNGLFAHFIFANLNGTISAWNTGTTAFIQATTTGASYTGLAINKMQTQLYAANDIVGGGIDVFNSSFSFVKTIATPTSISSLGLVPFNVQDINGQLYVTYAPAIVTPGDRTPQTQAPLGAGAVVVFNEDGSSPQILISGSDLAAPWGVALAPASFGEFGGALLVGNFSYVNSEINAYDPMTGAFEGTIPVGGAAYTPGGLWDLNFGIGGSNGSPNTLYITDGIDGETGGLFAAITPTPEPSGLAILGTALALFGVRRWSSRRQA